MPGAMCGERGGEMAVFVGPRTAIEADAGSKIGGWAAVPFRIPAGRFGARVDPKNLHSAYTDGKSS